MAQLDVHSMRSSSVSSSAHTTRKHSPEAQTSRSPSPSIPAKSRDCLHDDGHILESLESFDIKGIETWATLENIASLGFSLNGGDEIRSYRTPPSRLSLDHHKHDVLLGDPARRLKKPFHRWIRTLRRRHAQRHGMAGHDSGSPFRSHVLGDNKSQGTPSSPHRKSSSASSFNYVTAVRSAGTSLAGVSLLARSRRNTLFSSRGHSRADHSSRASVCGVRLSEDSACLDRSLATDPAVAERALQRRRILEELINTEEGYIGDIRFLMNVYVTILASLPTLPAGLRASISRNLTEIVELHEELLGDLHHVVPDSEYTQCELLPADLQRGIRGHHRWRSLDAVPEDKDRMSWLQTVPGTTADPQVAAEVAKLFSRKMNRFFVYEEYGARYETMIKDIASAHRTMPHWETYQKGLEALAASLGSSNNPRAQLKKSLTIGDLLVKPIQRVCRYPLLFAELLKYTPVCDCPYSHMEIETMLSRLREATAEINRATDSTRVKATLEKTWILQDRLVFPNQRFDATSKNRIRYFGHIQLCGVLHVCWQTKEGVDGQYMICLLYRDWLCLASASKTDQTYTIQGCIRLNNVKLEEADNGRGLQCHTAPFSWKLVFECDYQLYEVIMTACSKKEEIEWRERLHNSPAKDSHDPGETNHFSSLALNIKSLGIVFGKPGTIARRMSIHRATTVGPKSPLCQVIVKDTSVIRETQKPASNTSPINRSQSLLTTKTRLPVLAPARGDRARLEALLSDVWTREVLPYPGMTVRARSEHLVRTSASVIRKISVASIASTFSRRSASLASLHKAAGEDSSGDSTDFLSHGTAVVHDEASKVKVICETQGAAASRLSVIQDEIEKCSPPAVKIEPADKGREALSGVRRLDFGKAEAKLEAELQVEEVGTTSPALRSSSANSVRLSRPASQPSKGSPCASDKENFCQKAPSDAPKMSSHKGNSHRWPRVGGIHRGAMAQGIRSLFR